MSFIGQIESADDPQGIDKDRWTPLVALHPTLAVPPTKRFINPFTGAPAETQRSSTTAVIRVDGIDAGSIYWAMDGSPMLIVRSIVGCHELVSPIAEEIAKTVGGRVSWEWYE